MHPIRLVYHRPMANSIDWATPPSHPALSNNEIHIFQTQLDIPCEVFESLASLLSDAERDRAARMVQQHDKVRRTSSAAFLRQILALYLDQPARAIEFAAGPHGKPILATHPSRSELRFNNTHSGGMQWVVVSRNCELGIDLEKIRPDVATMEVAEHHFSSEEIRDLSMLQGAQRTEGFFRCWTRKEAYLKARGVGLQIPLKSFSVTLKADQPPVLTSADSADWSLYSLEPGNGFVGALVAHGRSHTLRFFHWPPQE